MCVFSGTDFNTCFNAALAAVILSMFDPGKRPAMEPEPSRTITTLSTASWAEASGTIKIPKRRKAATYRQVLDCASHLTLFKQRLAYRKRQRSGAVQDAAAPSGA